MEHMRAVFSLSGLHLWVSLTDASVFVCSGISAPARLFRSTTDTSAPSTPSPSWTRAGASSAPPTTKACASGSGEELY